MLYLSDNLWRNIWMYLYPIKELHNPLINESINKILKKSNYCIKCGENGKCSKCDFCDNIHYFYCDGCKYSEGNNLVCCVGFYNKYGMLN